jgi:uncharacterized membrane protein YdbT with pleckstrin-like domain
MQTRSFKPSPKYLYKMLLLITLLALVIPVGGVLLSWLIGREEGVAAGVTTLMVVLVADVAWWVPALVLTGPYYRSLSYEIQDDEVIVRVGILTQSVKHVPYRTVTNITIKRDIFDRWLFGLGTLNIQTAGMSGTTGAEEKLVGLTNVEEVYDMVVTELRRFRGSMAPTAAEVEPERAVAPTDALSEILAEVRAIRQALQKGE